MVAVHVVLGSGGAADNQLVGDRYGQLGQGLPLGQVAEREVGFAANDRARLVGVIESLGLPSTRPAGVDGDAVVMFNFRGDRAIEISQTFDDDDFDHFDRDGNIKKPLAVLDESYCHTGHPASKSWIGNGMEYAHAAAWPS